MRALIPTCRAAALLLPLVLACTGVKTKVGGPVNLAATTTATPPPGPFNGSITVTLTTNKPANIFATIDGSDPHVESASRFTAPDMLAIPLTQTTTINVYSVTPQGAEEKEQSLQYTRAGGPVGTASGVIVVGSVAVNDPIGLEMDGTFVQTFPALTAPGQIPFQVTGLMTGSHSFRAGADRYGAGQLGQLLDYYSPTVTVNIDLTDPFHASAENIVLLLGASQDGLCTIEGTIDVPAAALGQSVSVSAIDAGSLGNLTGGLGGLGGGGSGSGAGGASGIQGLLSQLMNGYQVFAMGSSTTYPYAITNLQPGNYVVIPVITAVGTGGLGMDFQANPFNAAKCTAGGTVEQDFAFGPVQLNGNVTATMGSGFGYGMVAARSISLKTGIQAVLSPTLLFGGSGGPMGPFTGSGLLSGDQFDLRAYTSFDSSSSSSGSGSNPLGNFGGPIISALTWVINPLASDPPQASFTASGTTVTENISDP
jgi:hypothetical protein